MGSADFGVVVIGAGQAGLATSHELTLRGVEHVVLERADAVGATWAGRWNSFCLVSPNHTLRLPGGQYEGADPGGYLHRDEIVAFLGAYAARIGAPVRTGVQVASLVPAPGGWLTLGVAGGDPIRARQVVVATGAFPSVHRPPWVGDVPSWLPVLDVADYRSPTGIPPGAVLVVGSGQTGCQIAEELALSGRRVLLACGRSAWLPRRIEGRDVFDWLLETPFFDQSLADLPGPGARFLANPQLTGTRGGHDLHTRVLAAMGVQLLGHLSAIHDGTEAVFADDLDQSVAWGDARYTDLRATIQGSRARQGLPVPDMPDPAPFDVGNVPERLRLKELGAVILTAGYRPNYSAWIEAAGAFDSMGFPIHVEGRSTVVPGLHFVGVHFLRTRRSALLFGVGDDARQVAGAVAVKGA